MGRISGLTVFVLGAMLLCASVARTQGIFQISTDEKISRSSLIIEGKVTAKKSYWNERRTMIYTSNMVEVYKIFKGSSEKNTIEIVTVGGAVGNHYIHASHLLELEKDDIGIFFCNNTSNNVFDVYSSSQGFIKYDLFTKKAFAPFVQYGDIESILYPELNNKIKQRIQIRNSSFNIEKASRSLQIQSNSTLAPAISGFSPASVDAGALMDPTHNVLTITGTGFGAASSDAAVLFSHADYAPGTQFAVVAYNSPLIISWSDTEIKVRVPAQAGTGVFRVRDNSGAFTDSPSDLDVRFSILNADFGGEYGIKQFNLGSPNGSGGYNIKYSTNTANSGVNINASPAKATFQRALATWKESAGVNFAEGGTSNLQTVNPDDGENLVMFDNGGTGLGLPLASGVLATCFSGITICTNNPAANQALKTGFDIVIRNTGYSSGSTPFTLGPCPPFASASAEVDLESVLLHELGHALNLGHIVDRIQGSGNGTINPAKVMNYSVSMNQRRISIDYSAKSGAAYQITQHNYTYGNCTSATPEMVPVATILDSKDDCPGTFPATTTPLLSVVNFDLTHATSNKLVDPAYTQMTLDASGTNVTNTLFYPIRTNNTGGTLSMEVKNYETTPAAISSCAIGFAGIQTTGVKMSLYKVNGCPNGGAFPTPIAFNIFKNNGALPVINNLSESSNYLLVVDGLQNTKAKFDITFSGTALLERVTELQGSIFDNHNLLSWTTDTVFNIASMTLEKSADGIVFSQLRNIVGDNEQGAGQHEDNNPFSGKNYYRLAIENTNGTTDYSDTVLLTRSETLSLSVLNNGKVTDELSVRIVNNSSSTYAFNLQNTIGQLVLSKETTIASGSQIVSLPVNMLPRGVYYLSIYGKDKKRVRSMTIKLR